ncbi:hypothetical protein DXG01_010933 [Tephrocybe rancida]|nr:hypothetical protein DXG01_010933 [Tephrocybe rancida]
MGERKKRTMSALPLDSIAASSSAAHRQLYQQTARSPSPPASAYFPLISGDTNARLWSTPDAEAHFAYSTTLRRHPSEAAALSSPAHLANAVNAEAQTLWSRAVGYVTGRRSDYESLVETGRVTPPVERDVQSNTASAQFAHTSAQVCNTFTTSLRFPLKLTSIKDTISHFRTSADSGLLQRDIANLLVTHGYNEFSVSTPEPVLLKFAKTIYESPLILLLCGSASVSAIMGNIDDAVSITVAVLIVLTVGFVQERRSEKSLEALNKLVPHHCHVLREGETKHVIANELVPGDIVTFSTGDRIPADIRIVSSIDLEIDESSLTGETEARKKNDETCQYDTSQGRASSDPVALADRTCIAYMGTLVRNGRGTGVVIATGTATEFGVIFSMMQDVEEKRTPLQLSMDELAKKLSFMSFGVIGVICLIGVLQQRSWLEMFTIGVSLAVAAIPEGLPIVTTVTLALGVLRMSKRKAIVKKLHSVESLGSVSVICSDKTGTLTKNDQTVTEAYAVDEAITLDPNSTTYTASISPALRKTMDIGAICNNASLVRNEDGQYVGQSTDVALLNVLEVFGLPDRRPQFERVSERPFNSEQKYMAVSGYHRDSVGGAPGASLNINGGPREMYYIKGSIEAILDRCKFYYVNDESTPALDTNTRNVILSKAQATAARGLRVLAMAYGFGSMDDRPPSRTTTSRGTSPTSGAPEKSNLVFAGFQSMLDPPRKGVADSIALLQSGGVQVVMITGDSEQTALSIAQQLGMRVGRGAGGVVSSGYCLTGKAIDQMTKAQLKERVGSVSVFARTTPRHKMAIVEAFQARGQVVAMTGDGVNDAPALKMADIGVSMGKSGTDVAKEAADVILVDDNFSTILPAVEEGEFLATMLGLSNPLNAMQILFINILMDGPPSQSLGVDPVDPAIMKRPPRKKNAPIITKRLLFRVLFSASIIVIGTLFVYVFALEDDNMSRREQTMTFTCFVFLDLVSAVQNRGLGCGLMQNKMLVGTVSVSALTQLALVYVPFMQKIFQTAALSLSDLSVILSLAALSLVLHEGRRTYERKLNAEESYTNVMEEMA